MKLYHYETAIGRISVAEKSGRITDLFFEADQLPYCFELSETAILKEAFRQLESYLAGNLKEFSLPLEPQGTVFMQSVWQALGKIPYGTTASYKDVAVAVGKPNAARAVGQANNRNPLPVFIPCHRVIGTNGKLVGYSSGVDLKEKLLDIERRHL